MRRAGTRPGSRPGGPSSATDARWTGDPRSFQTTVAVRDLLQVLLVIILSVVEGPGLHDLRGDGSEPALCQNLKEQPSSAFQTCSEPHKFTCSDAAFLVCSQQLYLLPVCGFHT